MIVRERQLVDDPADELDRDVGRAGDRHAEASTGRASPVGVVEDRLVERRRRPGGPSRRSAATAAQRAVDVEHRLGQHRRARGDRRQDPGLEPEHVEVRVHHQVAVAGGRGRSWPPSRWPPGACGRGSARRPSGAPVVPDVKRMSDGVLGADAPRRAARTSARASSVPRARKSSQRPRPRPHRAVDDHDDRARARAASTPAVVEQRDVVGAEEVGDRDEHPGAAASEDVGRLGPLEPRVDRDEHGAGLEQAEQRRRSTRRCSAPRWRRGRPVRCPTRRAPAPKRRASVEQLGVGESSGRRRRPRGGRRSARPWRRSAPGCVGRSRAGVTAGRRPSTFISRARLPPMILRTVSSGRPSSSST